MLEGTGFEIGEHSCERPGCEDAASHTLVVGETEYLLCCNHYEDYCTARHQLVTNKNWVHPNDVILDDILKSSNEYRRIGIS